MISKSRSAVPILAFKQIFRFKFKQKAGDYISYCPEMDHCFNGEIAIPESQVNLEVSLLGGQSFRWRKVEQSTASKLPELHGVACNAFWQLSQSAASILYKVYPAPGMFNKKSCKNEYFRDLLRRYLRLDFDLNKNLESWRAAHEHFATITPHMKAVRVLDQEPLENILSFICSQNNHIKRISTMIDWFCSKYGQRIGHFNEREEYTFPTLSVLLENQKELELMLREAKFGYRAKFIAQTIAKIVDFGGEAWFDKLRAMSYADARNELVRLPGIGYKVADCICLMSLGHLEAVPIDTHIYKIAQTVYMRQQLAKVKTVTPRIYEEIANHLRTVYGPYAGWAQAVLFCADLQQFQTTKESAKIPCLKEKSESCSAKPKKKRK
ncbi:N-glycosylase/DNA lyase [Anastrepha ludens]|uniref:N-glycosylase/DNA lyase n=1 Tax=Anastrepha ludens TaxID=28586 RepID=UPI0023AFBC1A|nr:N-glycosylase/DNA lyase [Anastrepha ludens]